MMDRIRLPLRLPLLAALLATGLSAASPAAGQWVRQNEQFYLPAEHNWVFRENYRAADRLFNAFDYGHAILYEELWRRPGAPEDRLEEREYDFITQRLLNRPPRVPLEEGAIEVAYARLAPEAKLMFEWAHILHRQIYDVLGDARLSQAEQDAAIAELLAYYRTRPDLAFSSRPKNMELMEGQYYSTAFRDAYPKFNGLIWAYHWLQVGLYEPLLAGTTEAERQTGVAAAVTRFRQMLENAPENMPRVMPMTAAVAPEFARRYPEAAIIFDNLHGMHDVISDILASPEVPRDRKRAEILLAAERYRDDTSFVMTEEEWRSMSMAMGPENMGGPATGFLPGFPEPTVARGAVMAHGAHGAAAPAAAMPAHRHPAQADTPRPPPMQHGPMHADSGHAPLQHGAMPHGAMHGDTAHHRALHALHVRMMQDTVIRARMMRDTALHGAMMRMMAQMPAEHRAGMMRMMHGGAPPAHPHAMPTGAPMHGDSAHAAMRALHEAMMADPAIRQRMMADPELHGMMMRMMEHMPPEHRRRMMEMMQGDSPAHRH